MADRLTAAIYIAAIEGSKGIKTTICKRIPCNRHAFDRALKRHPTVKAAYDAECAGMLDKCHSILIKNIEIAETHQVDDKLIDTADIKWYLARKGRDQGFGTDPAVVVTQHTVTLADFRNAAAARLAQVEDLEEDET